MKLLKKTYFLLTVSIVLLPNIFVVVMGIESFPYTCAPMFGHYIDDTTDLYLFKLEGVKNNETTDLTEFYGKTEDFFMRHFFSKVYGSTKAISPFTNKLSESPEYFNKRMNAFFDYYTSFLKTEYKKSFDNINVAVKKVDQDRNTLSDYEVIGYYDTTKNKYHSLYKPNLE